MSKGLDPDEDQQNVGPDLGQNYFQRLSADEKNCELKGLVPVWSPIFLDKAKMSRDMRFPTMWYVQPAKGPATQRGDILRPREGTSCDPGVHLRPGVYKVHLQIIFKRRSSST